MAAFYSWAAAFAELSARDLTAGCQLTLVWAFLAVSNACAEESLRVGAATADITPPTGYPMWGYAARHNAACTGVLDPLKARAVVLANASTKLAIVSLDLGRAPVRESTRSIRDRLKVDGITDIMLVASHTHHGPVLELDTWPNPKTPYTRTLEEKLVRGGPSGRSCRAARPLGNRRRRKRHSIVTGNRSGRMPPSIAR